MQRNTRQREAIATLLQTNPAFYSAQDLHAILETQEVKIGLSTVYRILSQMVTSREVDVVVLADGQALYRLCSEQHHHHIRCRNCGNAIEITLDEIENLAKKIGQQHGFIDIEHTIEMSGICERCAIL